MKTNQINKNLNIFIKYNDKTDRPGIETMKEHLKVYVDKGKVLWGHFTKTKTSRNKIGLWNLRTPMLDYQLENNIPTFVFFYSRASKELYVGNLLNYYNRDYPDTHSKILDYIPKYYHDRVGSIDEKKDIGTMRSYAFVEVTNLRKIDFEDTDFIYNFKGDSEPLGEEKVLESKGMASLLYINLEKEFYERLSKGIKNIISNTLSSDDLNLKVGSLVNQTPPPKPSDLSESKDLTNSNTTKGREKSNGKNHSIENDIKNKALGLVGEQLVLKLEKERVMLELGEEYSNKVEHVSETKGDYEGYDILSWEKLDDGSIVEKYIEVKTTQGDCYTQFFISSGEVNFSRNNSDQYYLYRIYGYDRKLGTADYFIQKGSIEDNYNLIPKNYSVSLKKN